MNECAIQAAGEHRPVRIKTAKDGLRAEPRRHERGAGGRTRAAPWPLKGILDHVSTNGVENDISRYCQKVLVSIDQMSLESPLKKMSHATMTFVEPPRIVAADFLHAAG